MVNRKNKGQWVKKPKRFSTAAKRKQLKAAKRPVPDTPEPPKTKPSKIARTDNKVNRFDQEWNSKTPAQNVFSMPIDEEPLVSDLDTDSDDDVIDGDAQWLQKSDEEEDSGDDASDASGDDDDAENDASTAVSSDDYEEDYEAPYVPAPIAEDDDESEEEEEEKADGPQEVKFEDVDLTQTLGQAEILAILKAAKSMPALEGGKMATKLLRSVLVTLLVPTSAASAEKLAGKSKFKETKQSRLTQTEQQVKLQEKYQLLRQKAPFQIGDDVQGVIDHCLSCYVIIDESLKTKKLNLTSSFVIISTFLSSRRPVDNLSRALIAHLTPRMIKALMNEPTQVISDIARRAAPVWSMADSTTVDKCAMVILEFYANLGRKVSSSKGKAAQGYREVFESAIRRGMTGLQRAGMQKLNFKEVENVSKIATALTQVFSTIDQPALIYDVAYSALRGLGIVCSQFLAKSKKSKTKRGKLILEKDIKARLFTWSTLLTAKIWIECITLENENAKYSLTKLAEGWAVLLTTLVRSILDIPRQYPFGIKCLDLLVNLMTKTGRYIPLGEPLLRMIVSINDEVKVKDGKHLGRPVSIATVCEMNALDVTNLKNREDISTMLFKITRRYLGLLAHHPSFPEATGVFVDNLKKVAKNTKSHQMRLHVKDLVQQIESTSRLIQAERADLTLKDLPHKILIFTSKQCASFPICK